MLKRQSKKNQIQTKRQLRKVSRLFKQKLKQIGLLPGTLFYNVCIPEASGVFQLLFQQVW